MPDVLESIALNHSRSLIDKSQRGDQQAFGKLVGLWFKRIYNFSLKYFGDHDLAMEATQQTFIAVYRKLGSLRKADSFRFWLYKVALNICREEERRMKKRSWLSLFGYGGNPEPTEYVFEPEREYQKLENEEMMARLLRSLPEEQRTVVIMKEYEGLKFREIAEALGIPENTAKTRLYNGLNNLRKKIEEGGLTLREGG
jgi:RNA polymerase sigma factor (sigma-70 family)